MEEQKDPKEVYDFLASCVNLYGDEDKPVTAETVHEVDGETIILSVEKALKESNFKEGIKEFAQEILECLYRTKDKTDDQI